MELKPQPYPFLGPSAELTSYIVEDEQGRLQTIDLVTSSSPLDPSVYAAPWMLRTLNVGFSALRVRVGA